jgi:CSLREA domain-containing protein
MRPVPRHPPYLAIAVAVLGSATAVGAVTFTVNGTVDAVDVAPGDGVCATAGGVCTLRAAVQEANAHVGTDTISIPAGTYTLSLGGRDEELAATGDLDVTEAVIVAGASASTVVIDGNGVDRVFDAYADLTISNVTIEHGNPGAEAGGALISSGTLVMTNVVVTQNQGALFGGGIVNDGGVMALSDVTVSDNTCAGSCAGGGIYNNGPATLDGVTLSGNTADAGGGIYSDQDVTLTNCTLSGNTSNFMGAAIKDSGATTLINVTISDNTAGPDGGAVVSLGDFAAKYTIFAHSPANEACMDFGNSWTSNGHNIDVGATCLPAPASGDLVGTDPALAPLANYGGPTATRALLPGSPAVDAGGVDCPPPATDQRGATRPLDGNGDSTALCDIGAYESDGTVPTTTTTSSSTSTTGAFGSTSTSTSTTTLPQACANGATLASIVCRLGVVLDEVTPSTDLGRLHQTILSRVTRAHDRAVAAQTACDAQKLKPTKAAIKAGAGAAASAVAKIRSRSGRKVIPAELAAHLKGELDSVTTDLKALRKSVHCP